jgi:hypothetical protein
MKKDSRCEGPLLTRLSRYKSSPKWTISSQNVSRSLFRLSRIALGPAAYNPLACIDKTSKFSKLSPACSFGTSKRFDSFGSSTAVQICGPGPGEYSPPPDRSGAPYRSLPGVTFGVGRRSTSKKTERSLSPGPGEYDIRGKFRKGGTTFSEIGVHVNNRHGWYYDFDIKAARDIPAPGSYEPRNPNEKSGGRVTFGVGSRPRLDRTGSRGIPSPGRYEHRSALSGRSFSFTHGTKVTRVPQEHKVGAVCAQPTQFG